MTAMPAPPEPGGVAAPIPAGESERLEALARYEVLDTPPEAGFDRATRLAAQFFGVPMAWVSLIDAERQWFKSCIGVDLRQTPRDVSFCAHAILCDEVLVVPDTFDDPRFAGNPFVVGQPHLRFYAGAPLRSSDGYALGTLCVADVIPRAHPSPEEIGVLTDLAAVVEGELEMRLAMREQAAAESRARRLAAIVESSDDAILTKSLDGTILSWNAGAERLYGYRPEEVVGRQITVIVPPELAHEVPQILERIRQGERIEHYETVRVSKDGRQIDVAVTISPVKDRDGSVVAASAIARDISARKENDRQLAEAHRQAMEASRLKSDFLANMSHEIRTPMNAVIGMTELLLDTPLTDEQRDYTETVRRSGDALLSLINDILDYSKIESGSLELEHQPFDPRDCAEGAADLVAAQAAAKELELVVEIDDDVPPALVGDVTRLRQILVNLLSNAVKFTSAGEVVLRVRTDELADRRVQLHLEVRDTGIGIPADRIPVLFDSFRQVDASTTREYGGTGLGLTITKRLVEAMTGSVQVESTVGRGSTFSVTVPLPRASQPLPRTDPARLEVLIGRRALVVDDNATNRRLLHRQLTGWGLIPVATEDPQQAADWIAGGQHFDVAILDMQMPRMDGIDLAMQIRRHPAGATVPLIMLTSLGSRPGRENAPAFAGFLHKPVRAAALANLLAGVLAGDAAGAVDIQGTGGQPTGATSPQTSPTAGALRILLAEDNVVNQKVALLMLDRIGHRADVANNGLEVLQALKRTPYDVILMDVRMPEMDGLEATRRIRADIAPELQPHIVAMTANALSEDRDAVFAAGMNDFLPKPVSINELASALAEVAANRPGATRPPAEATEFPASPPPADRASAPAPEPAPNEDYDRRALGALVDRAGPKAPAMLARIADSWFTDAPRLLQQMRDDVARAETNTFDRAVHTLKSSSAMMGARALSSACVQVEHERAAGAAPDEGKIRRLQTLLEQADQHIRAFVDDVEARSCQPSRAPGGANDRALHR